MKGGRSVARIKNGGGGGVSSDLLVCFPTRAHLTLMPKPVCSPSRPTDHSKRRPLFRAGKPTRNQTGSEIIGSEPTSPKVTCAGQIKVRPKNRPGGAQSKNWLESVGFKKDVMNFLGALRGLRFNLHCFGSFPGPANDSSDEDEEEEEEVISGISKWFMMLEESQGSHSNYHQFDKEEEEEEENKDEQMAPPKNALLLMRCRSAPVKRGDEVAKKLTEEMEEENENEKKRHEESLNMVMMNYAPNFFKLSRDIAKETWLVGSVDPLLARSRSSKR